MATWQITHGAVVGGFCRIGVHELYVRQQSERTSGPGTPAPRVLGGWCWYIDGILMGVAGSEHKARMAAETAVRMMDRTHVGRMAS